LQLTKKKSLFIDELIVIYRISY